FASRFPDRYVNVGVAEQNLVGVAAGLARCGKMPWVYSIANFPTFRCLEQIRNDVCYHNGNVKVVAVGAGFAYGPHRYTHHGLEDVAVMRALPNMTVAVPADPVETRLVTEALADLPSPCYLRLGKADPAPVHATPPVLPRGWLCPLREGPGPLAWIASGTMVKTALAAAEHWPGSGVWSAPWVQPLDEAQVAGLARRYR